MTESPQNKGTLSVVLIVAVLVCVFLSHKKQSPTSTAPSQAPVVNTPAVEVPEDNSTPRLCVETEPAGASLLVDGKLAGSTPIRVEGLAPGSYGIRLEKEGCQPLALRVDTGGGKTSIRRKLEPLPTGSLQVSVLPAGSEVVLDGDVVGYTPLTLSKVTTGSHQLQVRKVNFDSYASLINIKSAQPAVYSGFALHDKVLAMLEDYVKREPQRVSHYIDLAHYHFVNDRLDKAVEIFSKAMEVNGTALNFDGPGYPGKANVSDAEMAQDEKLRRDDDKRLIKEIDKHKNWPGKDCREFRQKLDQAQEEALTKNGASWEYTDNAAHIALSRKDFEKATQIYRNHIAALGANSPDAPRAYAALLEVSLIQRDLAGARTQFNTMYELFDKNGDAMQKFGETLVKFTDRTTNRKERDALNQMAEKALRHAIEITDTGPALVDCQTCLGRLLVDTGRAAEAVPLFEKAVASSALDVVAQEDRQLRLGDALRKAGRLPEARTVYESLTNSKRSITRDLARLALAAMNNDGK
jgi:tetratricopeptide (TPR) repeat protein